MKLTTSTASPTGLNVDALVVVAHDQGLSGSAKQVDQAMGGLLERLIASGELSTKTGKTFSIYSPTGISAKLLIVCGGGSIAELNVMEVTRMAGAAAKRLADRSRQSVGLALDVSAELTTAAVSAVINGGVGQDLLRAEKNFKTADEWIFLTPHDASGKHGQIVGESMLLVRELVNLPPNLLTPSTFTERAVAMCNQCGIEIEVWDELRLRKERCGSLLGVASGSQTPPRLLIMRYAGKQAKPAVALVGKGVTFDSGGLSIKPTDGMLTMKCDMAGAATVLGTLRAAALLGLEQPIVGLVGLVENMISGSAFRLGDVLTARSGTTIEIHNTDAEGRLVLADVLNVALEQQPECIIDLATLTGACVVALGVDIAGLMTNDAQLQQRFQSAAERAGELVWPLPMHRFFDDQISSQVADIKNVGDGRWGGATTAAKFLERFVDKKPWLHIDIAGPAFADKPKPHQDAGATAAMLRSLIEFLDN
ncbi:MAG: leucyl aminopeptidase [Pirellulaceae bacterium]|nr:leucyl aminopeptidase [Pirellulaceae bacterium]